MEFSPQSSFTVNQILADVLREVDDEDYLLYPPGYYTHLIQTALEELSLDTFFLDLYKDFDMPTDTLKIEFPKGAFNLRQAFVWSGDNCVVENMRELHFKRNYRTQGADHNYTAKNRKDSSDYFIRPYTESSDTLYCSLQNGFIILSSTCTSYSKVRLYYNGVLTDMGSVPVIPLPFRQAVIDFVVEKTFRKLKVKDMKYRILWTDIYNVLYKPFDGTWAVALSRARNLDSKVLEDYKEYFSKMNY